MERVEEVPSIAALDARGLGNLSGNLFYVCKSYEVIKGMSEDERNGKKSRIKFQFVNAQTCEELLKRADIYFAKIGLDGKLVGKVSRLGETDGTKMVLQSLESVPKVK